MTTITAAVTTAGDSSSRIRTVELDDPRPDEVLVDIHAVGVCHTDISAARGVIPYPLPAVLGHEGAGVVAAVGTQVTEVVPGDKVVLSFDFCGACVPCRTGRPVRCVQWSRRNLLGGTRVDGSTTLHDTDSPMLHGSFFGQSSFATFALASSRSVVKLPPEADLRICGPLGCGVQTGAGSVLNVFRPGAGSKLLIMGASSVGLSALLATRLTPVTDVVVVDLMPTRLEMARALGATAVIDASSTDDVPAAIRDALAGGADYALEATGSVVALRNAIASMAVEGTVGIVGAPPAERRLSVSVLDDLLHPGIRITGINQGASVPSQFIPALLRLHERGLFPFDRLISFYPFEQIDTAIADSLNGTAIKPVLLHTSR